MTVKHNIDIRQGETFSFVYTYKDSAGSPINLTGFTGRMSVKRDRRSTNSVFFSTGSDAIGGTMTLGGSAGTITLTMTAAQTDAMDLTDWWSRDEPELPLNPSRCYLYDLEIVSAAGAVTRVLQGEIKLWRSITGPN